MMTVRPRGVLATTFLTTLLWCCAAAHAGQHSIPLFAAPGPGGDPQGVLRMVNDAAAAAAVSIHAIDDAGVRAGPAVLTLGAFAAVELSAAELQSGNPAKGLSAGLGDLSGDVRLSVDSDASVVPSAYVRGADGALAAMNATVLGSAGAGPDAHRYDVTLFHPAGHATQPSRLRLVNPGDAPARVEIGARDDAGTPAPGGSVQLTLPAGGAQTLTARQLETGGGAGLSGQLGAGAGNWRLSVTADRPIEAVHVAVDAAGGWSNLSTSAVAGWAPADAAAFEARFLDRAIVDRDGRVRFEIRVLAEGRIREVAVEDGVETTTYEGPYEYARAGRDAGRVALGAEHLGLNLYFSSATSGWYASGHVDADDLAEYWSGGSWWTLGPRATPLDLGAGPDDRTFTLGTAIGAATLPAAAGGDGGLTYSLSPEVPGLSFDPGTRRLSGTPTQAGEYLMTYRVRDAATGDTDWRYFGLSVRDPDDSATATYRAGEAVVGLPAGAWRPDAISNARFTTSGDDWTVEFDRRGHIEEGAYRYTCQSAGGCTLRNREVVSGSIARTPLGGGGSADGDDHGNEPASATTVRPGSDTPGALTAGDVDYFRVVVANAGTLQAHSTGGTDTYGQLEDAGGAVLRRNDDGGAGSNFRISEDVAAGTYFVRVRGYGAGTRGAYTLHVRLTGSDPGTTTPPTQGGGDCRVGMTLNPGGGCTYPGTDEQFTVTPDGRGRFLIFTSGGSIDLANSTVNGRTWDFAASNRGGGVWRIDRVAGGAEAPADDRAVLVAVYEATDGPSWVNNENWLTDAPLGEWYGVEVDSDGRVIRLELSGGWDSEGQRWVLHGLKGRIPPSLGNLSELQVLDLNLNELSGPIPSELGNLAKLEELKIPNNNLSGAIPPELGNLSNLLRLNLANNKLSGPIPLELANLTRAYRLGLGWNAGLCVPSDPSLRAWMINLRNSLLPCPTDDGVRLLPRALMREDGNGLSLALPTDLQAASLSVSDSTIVRATIDGKWLRLSPLGLGTAEVTLMPSGGQDPAIAGVVVRSATGQFGIDIVLDQPAPVGYEEAVTAAADWWSSVLAETEWPDRQTDCNRFEGKLEALADELVIWARSGDNIGAVGVAATCFRNDGGPVALTPGGGVYTVENAFAAGVGTATHEIGHILGLVLWPNEQVSQPGLVSDDGNYFVGTQAVDAFRAGGGDPALPGVPILGPHWSREHVKNELMTGDGGELDSISLAALADAGYNVDMTYATPWRKPASAQAPREHTQADFRDIVLMGNSLHGVPETATPMR